MTGLTIVYVLFTKLAVVLFASNQVVSIIWPPSGIALAALLLSGLKFWPVAFVGALAGSLWIGNYFTVAIPIAAGNTLEALTGYWLLRTAGSGLQRPEDYLNLLFSGGVAACIGALFGSSALYFSDTLHFHEWTKNFSHWWMGDMLGIAMVTPLILASRKFPAFEWRRSQVWTAAAYIGAAFIAGQVIFLQWPLDLGQSGKAFYMFAFVAYGALFFGLYGTLILLGMVMLQNLFSVVLNVGYFAHDSSESGVFLQWSFLLIMSMVGILLALAIEQHKRSEQAVKTSNALNRQILQSLREGVVVYDDQCRYMQWNQFMEKLSGVDAADCLGKLPVEVFPQLAGTVILNGVQRALAGETVDYTAPFYAVAGEQTRWVRFVQSPLRDESGRIIGVIELVNGISQGIAFDQCQDGEACFQSIIDQVPAIIYCKDPEGNYLLTNRRYQQLLAASNDALLGKQDYDWFSADTADAIRKNDLAVLHSGIAQEFEEAFPNPVGEIHTFLAHKFPLINARDEIYAVCSIQIDITGQKQSQWAQLSKFIEAYPDGMLLVAESGAIKLVNSAAANMFAYPLEELIGCNVDELVPAAERVKHRKQRMHFIRRDAVRPMSGNHTFTGLRKDGSEFPVEIGLRTIEIDRDRLIMVSVLDVSERKRVEHELQLMALVYRAIGEAVVIADANNRILAINEAFTRLTGYTEQDAIGKTTDLLKSGKHGPDFYQSMWHSLSLTGRWQGEIWNKRKNGDLYQEWLVINTIYNSQGEVERRVAMFSEVTEQKQAEQAIWRQANFDPLTDLANRRMFHDRLNQEIKKSQRNKNSLAVMLLDLDRFKEVNDTLGHLMGDQLLQETAKRILACVRNVDTVARLGGDEFTVILGDLDSESSADRVAQKILQKLADPFLLGNEPAHISVSIGITIYPQDAQEVERLIKNADQAMYSAKQQGRNRYSYFTAQMEQEAQERLRLTRDLRVAIMQQQFRLFYQPIVEIGTGKIREAEALIRWQHPTRGFISPSEFLPLAEETGLIVEIGDWVFHTAAQQVAEWRAKYLPDFKVGINQSQIQFTKNLQRGNEWLIYLKEQGLSGQSIIIEITEALLQDTNSAVRDYLLGYRDALVQVAIDDFGTGHSSLSFLKLFDINYLKIDRCFTSHLSENTNDLVLCEAIVVMAHKLGLKVIAEGIETEQQLRLLHSAGCDYGQGYFFSKPVASEEFADLFNSEWAIRNGHAITRIKSD